MSWSNTKPYLYAGNCRNELRDALRDYGFQDTELDTTRPAKVDAVMTLGSMVAVVYYSDADNYTILVLTVATAKYPTRKVQAALDHLLDGVIAEISTLVSSPANSEAPDDLAQSGCPFTRIGEDAIIRAAQTSRKLPTQ